MSIPQAEGLSLFRVPWLLIQYANIICTSRTSLPPHDVADTHQRLEKLTIILHSSNSLSQNTLSEAHYRK